MSVILDLINRGGVLVIPLGFCSFIGLVIVFERFIFWFRLKESMDYQSCLNAITTTLLANQDGVSRETSKDLLWKMFQEQSDKPGQWVDSVDGYVAIFLMRAKRGMSVIEWIISTAPMLGILGTILGIIASFKTLGQGGHNPKLVLDGISQALITTAMGLSISVILSGPYAYFQSKMDRRLLEVESLLAKVKSNLI